jgi:hypothetical protein
MRRIQIEEAGRSTEGLWMTRHFLSIGQAAAEKQFVSTLLHSYIK